MIERLVKDLPPVPAPEDLRSTIKTILKDLRIQKIETYWV